MRGLAELRRRRGFSQRALAQAADMSPSTVYQLENGIHEPTPTTIRKLAGALGIDTEEVFEAVTGKAEAPSRSGLLAKAKESYSLPRSLSEEEQADVVQALRTSNTERQLLRRVRAWIDLLDSKAKRWEQAAEAGRVDRGFLAEVSDEGLEDFLAIASLVRDLKDEGLLPLSPSASVVTGALFQRLERLGNAGDALESAFGEQLSRSELARHKANKADREAMTKEIAESMGNR